MGNGKRPGISGAALVVALAAAVVAVSAQGPAQGQGAGGAGRGGAPQPLVDHELKPNIHWFEGGGGNTGVIVGTNGVIVIDAKTTAAAATELVADIAKITPKPITTVLITHSDGDHVNGLQSFPKGLTIIAHENCKTEMLAAPNAAEGGPLALYMPTRTVNKNMEDMTIEGVHLRVYNFGPAHTSGDLMIYLPDEKIMFAGDMVALQSPYPLIHLEKNGSSDGWVRSMNGMMATDATVFVSGHGTVQTKADLQKRVADMGARRDQIKSLIAQGKSLDDVRQGLNEPPPAARGGGAGGGQPGGAGRSTFPNFQDFTGVVYAEQTKK
jgi:cyclase